MPDYEGQYLNRQFGSYRLVKLLGEGGFAEVYLGEHIHLGTYAAVKVLITKLTEDEVEQFRNEARTMIGLSYPNIMRVLDFGLAGRIPFIVMDYAPRGSLRKIHPKGSRVPLSTIVNYVKQIAAALQYVHEQKLIHRDVKSENMLLGRNNEVLLSDFGIAAVAHSTRSLNTGDGSGTIYYMSPEQIQGKPRIASDQYSLAIVVYEWLTGERPFNGTYWEIASQHLSTPPPPLHEKVPTIPPDVEKVVMTALEKDPKKRFGSIQAFARALEEASKRPDIGTTLLTYRGHSKTVNTLAWSPNGAYLASAGIGNSVLVWDAATGNTIATYACDTVDIVAWSPDGRYLAAGTAYGWVYIWDTVNMSNILTYQDHKENVIAIKWSADNRNVFSASHEYVQVKDVTNGNILYTYSYNGDFDDVGDISWSANDTRFAFHNWRAYTLEIIDIATKKKITLSVGKYPHSLVIWSPNNQHLANVESNVIASEENVIASASDATIHLWDTFTGKNILTHTFLSGFITNAAWSPDGKHIALSSVDKMVRVWDYTTKSFILIYSKHSSPVNAISWSPDGTRIASGDVDGIVHLWQAR